MNKPPRTVAIDGPVASGKSSVGLLLARRWGYTFVDTGMMYRAMAWWALNEGISADDPRLKELAAEVRLDVDPGPTGTGVRINGVDVTSRLRDAEVEQAVSQFAAVPAIRRLMVEQQRRLAVDRPVIMAGRDIGTVVLPDVDLKVYLQASVARRAERRASELQENAAVGKVEAVLRQRDRLDSERDVSPLRPAADAVIIDTDDLTLDEVVDRIVALSCRRTGDAQR